MKKEGQQFGPNQEWEVNREQNIAIANRIDRLIQQNPWSINPVIKLVMRGGVRLEDLIKKIEGMEQLPDFDQILHQEEQTLGHEMRLRHVENRNALFLGVAYSRGYIEEYHAALEILPESFNFPLYIIKQYAHLNLHDDAPMTVSSPYGKLPSDIIGKNGLWYILGNYYCINSFGQGAKIEDITEMGRIENEFEDSGELREAQRKLTRVNFVPSEEHSRVVPLTPEDYQKVNKMLKDIDVGLYKHR